MTKRSTAGRSKLPQAQLRVLKAAKKARDKNHHWWLMSYYHDMQIWRKLQDRGYAHQYVIQDKNGYYILTYSITPKGNRALGG